MRFSREIFADWWLNLAMSRNIEGNVQMSAGALADR